MSNIDIPNHAIIQTVTLSELEAGHAVVFTDMYAWLLGSMLDGKISIAKEWSEENVHVWVKTKDDLKLAGPGDIIHYSQDGTLAVEIVKRKGKLTKPPEGLIMGENAHEWKKNGDHPNDYKYEVNGFENGELVTFSPTHQRAMAWEGQVVRYFRHPYVSGEKVCEDCGYTMHVHGWIDQGSDGITVCPGDTVITQESGYAVLQGPSFVEFEK